MFLKKAPLFNLSHQNYEQTKRASRPFNFYHLGSSHDSISNYRLLTKL